MEGWETISVVAPSHERSASAQSLTLAAADFWEQVAEHEWSVEGTPTDAVILALQQTIAEPPDLVISGINRGGNLGENIFYSGTVGAAMEAAINHVRQSQFPWRTRERLPLRACREIRARFGASWFWRGNAARRQLNVNVRYRGTAACALRASPRSYAQRSSGGDRPARPLFFLASRARAHRRARSGKRLRRGFRRSRLDDAAPTRPHARNLAQSSLPLGAQARIQEG